MKSFLTITINAVDDLFDLRSFTLDTLKMPKRHLAINLHNCLSTSFKQWNVFNKMSGIVHDDSLNIAVVMKLNS